MGKASFVIMPGFEDMMGHMINNNLARSYYSIEIFSYSSNFKIKICLTFKDPVKILYWNFGITFHSKTLGKRDESYTNQGKIKMPFLRFIEIIVGNRAFDVPSKCFNSYNVLYSHQLQSHKKVLLWRKFWETRVWPIFHKATQSRDHARTQNYIRYLI